MSRKKAARGSEREPNPGEIEVHGGDRLLADSLQKLVEKYEPRVDRHLSRLNKANRKNSPEVTLRRLDRVFIAAAAGAGVVQGVGGAARKVKGGIPAAARRASGVALLGAGVLYVLARARIHGLSVSDSRVQEAIRSLAFASASLPIARGTIDVLARLGRPSVGLPRDPLTVVIMAAGGSVGGWAGAVTGRGLIDAVNDIFSNAVLEASRYGDDESGLIVDPEMTFLEIEED